MAKARQGLSWLALEVETEPAGAGEVAEILGRYAQGGATTEEISGPEASLSKILVSAYIPLSGPSARRLRELRSELAGRRLAVRERTLTQDDWLAPLKAHFKPLAIGRNFSIRPSWEKGREANIERQVIELDPGAAFGTGGHATTRLCLIALESLAQPGLSVLDLGTGTGVLAIAAAKLGAERVLALDNEQAAIAAAGQNARRNAVHDRISLQRGTLSRQLERLYRGHFDLVLANIAGKDIAALAGRLFGVLKPRGSLIVSGFVSSGLDEVLIKLALAGFDLIDLFCEEDWRAVIARRPFR